MITIVDFGMGNLRSIEYKIKKNGFECLISDDPSTIYKSKSIILPGVGHFGKAIQNIKKLNLIKVLNDKVISENTPILGICLGMQLFFDYSEEGKSEGLGWIPGKVRKFVIKEENFLPIPHVGWNYVEERNKSKYIGDIATSGTSDLFNQNGILSKNIFKVGEGRPNIVDEIKNNNISIIINTPLGAQSRFDEYIIGVTNYGYNFCSIV